MSEFQKHRPSNAKLNNARRHLRKLEIEAYASAVDVFRAQGVLTKEKLTALENLGKLLEIPIERHYAELRRALSDGELNQTAETLVGFDPSSSWFEEAGKFADYTQPFIPKARFTTNAFRAISNYYTNQMLRGLLPCEDSDSTAEAVHNNGVNSDHTEHAYHSKLNPLAAKIMREGGCDFEESRTLSRSYLTPVGLEELTDVFSEPTIDYGNLDNPPLSPPDGAYMDNYFLTTGIRRGTEPKTLPTKRRRCTSEHKSQTEDTPSYEMRRASEKNTPSSMSKVMQDYQMIMSLTKKKSKVDPAEAPTDRRRGKAKKLDSVTLESPGQTADSKNRSGMIVPCISIERMPLSQPKASASSPGKQPKSHATASSSPSGILKKPHIKRMKKKQLSQNTSEPQTPPGKLRRRVRIKKTLVSPQKTANVEMKSSETKRPSTEEGNVTILIPTDDVTSMRIPEETAVLSATGEPDTAPTLGQETQLPISETNAMETIEPHISITSLTMNDNIQEDVTVGTIGDPPPVADQLVTALSLSEQLPLRRKKDSSASLDIPSPDKIRSEMQSLYSPISSLGTPPDLERAAHFELSECTPLAEGGIPRPNFSPITSPEDSQSPTKEARKLAALSAERLTLVMREPCIDILPEKCSLALSDIVDEVCESISDPISPPLAYPSREDAKPSPDSAFANSSLMLSNALNSFITQVISEESPEHPLPLSLAPAQHTEPIDTQILTPVETSRLSAALSINQPTDSTEDAPVPTDPLNS